MGEKGARLTGQISLPGRYLVLIPNSRTKGISRRLSDNERSRLDRIIRKLKPENFGVIVRTAAEGVSEKALQVDIEKLVEEWDIVSNYKSGDAPKLIHQEPDVSIKVIREHLNSTFKKLLIDRKDQFDEIKNYVSATSPEISDIVDFYQDELMLFERYHIEDQIKKALDRKVWLPSGGHLIIDRTEALTVIDVNTGKFVGKNSLEETVYENNLEAAEEIARQLRLRDIGGIIVIDFIDMESTKKQQSLLSRFKQELAKDKTRTQVFEISRLGLVEMTRKNVAAGLVESFSEECEKCNGRGLIINDIFANKSIEEGLIESEAVVE
jgi:ribonuclease E